MTRQSSADLTRETYRGISLYSPNRAPCAIDLSDNTNLWGVPPMAASAIEHAAAASVTRYPALYANELKQALARYIGVEPEMIVTGCGSDDVLDSAIRAFADPGDRIVYPDPSFMMVPLFGRMNGLVPVPVPLTRRLDVDADAMINGAGRITYICSPNNPTGTLASQTAVRQVLDQSEGLVIIDEAYAEFTTESFAADAPLHDRLLVVRTMSKAFGLAGLRVGYAIGHPEIVAEVEKSRGPYKVNAIAECAAIAALSGDMAWVASRIAEALTNRERLRTELDALGMFQTIPSAANFVLAVVRPDTGVRAVTIASELRAQGVAVRPFSELPGIGEAIRITVGPWDMMEQCIRALEGIHAGRRYS